MNGQDTTASSTRETRDLLQHHFSSQEGIKLVVTRPLERSDDPDGGTASSEMAERYKKLSSTLSIRLESQNVEVEHWRQECNRYTLHLTSCQLHKIFHLFTDTYVSVFIMTG